MRKRVLRLMKGFVTRASAVLGTRSLRETIQRPLEKVVALDLRQRRIERLKRGEFDDLADPAVMAEAWR